MDDLPFISLITPTYNKSKFLPLTVHNFNSFNYPKNKIEWIIIDDSDESIKEYLPKDSRIKYYYFDKNMIEELYKEFMNDYQEKKKYYKSLPKKDKKRHENYKISHEHKKYFKGNRIPLGMKRNIAVQFASHDIIIHIDDDDYYPPDSLITRVNALKNNDCVGCSTIACFHINKMISLIYQPEDKITTSAKRISCATLAYKKSFWEKQKFNNQDIFNESFNFLSKRNCHELFWKDIIIAFYHKLNERNLFEGKEANGWHFYQIPDDLFKLFTSLDE